MYMRNVFDWSYFYYSKIFVNFEIVWMQIFCKIIGLYFGIHKIIIIPVLDPRFALALAFLEYFFVTLKHHEELFGNDIIWQTPQFTYSVCVNEKDHCVSLFYVAIGKSGTEWEVISMWLKNIYLCVWCWFSVSIDMCRHFTISTKSFAKTHSHISRTLITHDASFRCDANECVPTDTHTNKPAIRPSASQPVCNLFTWKLTSLCISRNYCLIFVSGFRSASVWSANG